LKYLEEKIEGETTKKTEFMNMIKGCTIPERFDQKLLDEASMMMNKWGEGYLHEGADSEYLFSHFGLDDKADDADTVKKEKAALRCVASKIFKSGLHKNDAVSIIKNFNSINEPGFRWLE
jgi:hypothetical protein